VKSCLNRFGAVLNLAMPSDAQQAAPCETQTVTTLWTHDLNMLKQGFSNLYGVHESATPMPDASMNVEAIMAFAIMHPSACLRICTDYSLQPIEAACEGWHACRVNKFETGLTK